MCSRFCILLLLFSSLNIKFTNSYMKVINTWPFNECTKQAWETLQKGTVLDAVEAGCNTCENGLCSNSVGFGGHPDEQGNTTLDAMIMDGETMEVGAVGGLERIKHAISVARAVLNYSKHTLIVGRSATEFAKQMKFREENLSTPKSIDEYNAWKKNNCQPNFRQNVKPDPKKSCGPYEPMKNIVKGQDKGHVRDTVGVIAIDRNDKMAVGLSTNGANHKIPGRVGDSPIPGSGGYVDNDVGAAVATGDGDVMMRFLPSYQAVEHMRNGIDPASAAELALRRISNKYWFEGALIAMNKAGEHGASCFGYGTFQFNHMTEKGLVTETIDCYKKEQ